MVNEASDYYREASSTKCSINGAECLTGRDCRQCNFALAKMFEEMYLRADERRAIHTAIEEQPIKKSKK